MSAGPGAAEGPASAAGSVVAVCVVHALIPGPKDVGVTAIDKRPVTGAVEVGPLGLGGDQVCDTKHHGGVEQAVYAYSDEEAAWWSAELGVQIPPGLFGENLRTSGVEVSGAEIGERWRIGGAGGVLLQVTAPRIPCVTFAARMGLPGWVKRFGTGGRPGAYLGIVEPGTVQAGDPIEVVHRPGHGVTVADTFPSLRPDVARRLLDAETPSGRPDGWSAPGTEGGFELTPKLRAWAKRQAAAAHPRS